MEELTKFFLMDFFFFPGEDCETWNCGRVEDLLYTHYSDRI